MQLVRLTKDHLDICDGRCFATGPCRWFPKMNHNTFRQRSDGVQGTCR